MRKKKLPVSEEEFTINKEYALRYEHNKKRDDLSRLKEEYDDSSQSSESEVEEDNPKIDAQILETISRIRRQDPEIYEKAPEYDLTYVEEQQQLKEAFKDDASDDELLVPRKRSHEERKEEEDKYEAFLKQHLKEIPKANDAGDEFLLNYVMKRGWKEDSKIPTYDQIVDDHDEEEVERAEEFETKYNFRFEQSTEITTHPRDVQSIRRVDDRRKKSRTAKQEREKEAQRIRDEDIQRMRNLKRQEYEDKLRQIQEAAGEANVDIDLEADFDPDEWDKTMAKAFDDSYYSIKGKKLKIDDLVDEAVPTSSFRYREVARESFGLDPIDILQADDRQLNEFISLKKLAPFKSLDSKKYKKRSKRFKAELWDEFRRRDG